MAGCTTMKVGLATASRPPHGRVRAGAAGGRKLPIFGSDCSWRKQRSASSTGILRGMPPLKVGPQSPFSKLAENAGTGSPGRSPGRGSPARSSRAGSPAAPPGVVAHDAFLAPRTHEGTQHRRLRTLLQEFLREATLWEETHTLEGIQLATSVKQAWEDVARCLATDESAAEARSAEVRRAQVVPLLQQLEECTEQLYKLLPRLVRWQNTWRSGLPCSGNTRSASAHMRTRRTRCCKIQPRHARLPRCVSPCGAPGRWSSLCWPSKV